MSKSFKEKLSTKIDEWDDEEVLNSFCAFFRRVEISPHLIQDNQTGLITHQVMVIECGEKTVASSPLAFEWPLQPANVPEDAEVAVN